MTKPSDYTEWSAGLWELTVNGTDYTANFNTVEFEERINEPVSWNMEVAGVTASSNTDFSKENIVEFRFDGTLAYRGRITHIDPQGDDGRIKLEGMGMAYDLMERKYPDSASSPKVYNGVAANTIVSDIVTSNPVGTVNTVDVTNDGSVLSSSTDFRMDEEGKLSGLSRLAGDYGGEWWIDESDNFNITDKKELGTSSVITYDDSNTDNIRKKDNAIEGDFDGVVVKGYGDGDDQIKATAGSTTDGDQVLVYTDKTITSEAQAQEKADSLNSSRGAEWQEVHIDIGDTRAVRSLGEYVDVQSEKGNVTTTTQYRIVERFYRIDFKSNVEEAKLVCNNREAGFYDKVVKQTEQETQSQTRNMQGARNVWGEKEASNASNAQPLTIDVYIPPDVNDLNDKNRTNNIKLNYTTAPYRQGANTVSAQTVDDTSDFREDRVDDTDRTRQDRVDDLPSNSVTVEQADVNDQNHDVASITSDAINNDSLAGTADQSFQSEPINSSGWDFITNVSASTDALAHLLEVQITDIDTTTDLDFVVATGGTVRMMWQAKGVGSNTAADIAAIDFDNYMVETGLVSMIGFTGGNTLTYNLYVASQGSNAPNCDFEISVTELNHEHNIPTNSNGVDLFDSGSANRLSLERDDGSNFESSATNESKLLTVEDQSDTKQSTVESTSDTKSDRVTQVDNDVVAGEEANDVSIIVDGTNIDGAGNTHGTNQDQEIDISSFLTDSNGDGKPDVGWHTVEIAPEPAGQVSFMKGRVFLDHHKDSTN